MIVAIIIVLNAFSYPLHRGVRYHETCPDTDYALPQKPPTLPILTQNYPLVLAHAPSPSSTPESLPFPNHQPGHSFHKKLILILTHPVVHSTQGAGD